MGTECKICLEEFDGETLFSHVIAEHTTTPEAVEVVYPEIYDEIADSDDIHWGPFSTVVPPARFECPICEALLNIETKAFHSDREKPVVITCAECGASLKLLITGLP